MSDGINVASGGIVTDSATGKILVGGAILPCDSLCSGSQPSALISITGTCDAICAVGGIFTFSGAAPSFDGRGCLWFWDNAYIELVVNYCTPTAQWGAYIEQTSPLVYALFGGNILCNGGFNLGTIVSGVECNVGNHVNGTFTLPGINNGIGLNCSGCMASVTVGP